MKRHEWIAVAIMCLGAAGLFALGIWALM